MALSIKELEDGSLAVGNCFYDSAVCQYLAEKGECESIEEFFIGIDRRSTPTQVNIFFDPEKAEEDNIEKGDEIGLFNLVSLSLNGVPFPPWILNPDLAYLVQMCEQVDNQIIWPQVIDSFSVQNSSYAETGQFVFPFYSLNGLTPNGELDIYKYSPLLPFEHCGYNVIIKSDFSQGESLMASANIPVGIDYDGPSFQILEALLDCDWENAVADLQFEVSLEDWENKRMVSCILNGMEADNSKFDEIIVFNNRILFKMTDEELYHIFLYAFPYITEQSVECYIYKLDAERLDQIERGQKINFFNNLMIFMEENNLSSMWEETDWAEEEETDWAEEEETGGAEEEETGGAEETAWRGNAGFDNWEELLSRMHNCQLSMKCCTIACSLRRKEENKIFPLSGISWEACRRFDFDTLSFGKLLFTTPEPISREEMASWGRVPCIDKYCEYVSETGEQISGHEMWFYRAWRE